MGLGSASRGIRAQGEVRLTFWVGMAPKKNCKQPQDSMLEKPVEDRVAPLESIGEEEPRPWEDQDEPESEEEQRSSVLFTQEQLEVLLKMGRPDFGELVAALKTGATKGERFQPAKPGNFNGCGCLACENGRLHTCRQGWTTFRHGACLILFERLCRHMVADSETRGGEEPWLYLGVI